jgi:hypothetical protein
MTDPRDGNEPVGDQELNASADEIRDIEQIDVEPDEAEKVKGGRAEDPCGGGQAKRY